MPNLKGTKTHENLKAAFAGESQANRRYLYFAKVADVEGYPEIAGNFRDTAEGETGHAHGHLDYLKKVGDPGHRPADRRHRARTSRPPSPARPTSTPTCTRAWRRPRASEGFAEIADWFETLAKAEKSHAGRFQKMLDEHQLSRSRRPRAGVAGRGLRRRAIRRARERQCQTHVRRPISYAPDRRADLRPGGAEVLGPGAPRRRRSRGSSRSATAAACASSTATPSRRCSSCIDEHARRRRAQRSRAGETDAVMDACFQCKLCEVQCPYTPRDGHPFQLDFPKLVHRYEAQRAHARGHRACATGCSAIPTPPGRPRALSCGLANTMNRVPPHRWFMEKTLGHPPRQAAARRSPATTFEEWAEAQGAGARRRRAARRCSSRPATCRTTSREIGRDTVEVLRAEPGRRALRRGPRAAAGCRPGSSGDLDDAARAARARNLDVLLPLRRGGRQGAGDQPDLLDDAAAGVPRAGGAGGSRARARSWPRRCSDPERVPLVDPQRAALLHATSSRTPGERSPTTRPATCARRRSASRAAISPQDPGRRGRRPSWPSAAATTAPTP